ncbi:MAG: hypothetical protein ABJL36_08770 [Hyphomicrobiales bacterium]
MAQNDAGLISGKIRELTRLIRETRLADTVTLEQFQTSGQTIVADRAPENSAQKIKAYVRLEALSQTLKGVYSEIPPSIQSSENAFTFALLPGTPPRFWVDLNSFVVMANDSARYQFLSDTRDKRVVLYESDELESTASAITDYVVERIVQQETQTTSEVDTNAQNAAIELVEAENNPVEPANISDSNDLVPETDTLRETEALPTPIIIQPAPAQTDWVKLFLAFSLGVFVGAVTLFLLAWAQTPSVS